jgi:hypothetical protein
MSDYIYSAEQIEAVSGGHVNLKATNNWATAGQWFSPIDRPSRGRARRFSRLNAIEAVLASRMMFAGVARARVPELLTLLAAHWRGGDGGWAGDHGRALESLPAFTKGSEGWFLALSWTIQAGAPELDEIKLMTADALGEWLGGAGDYGVTIPVSAIVAKVDALEPVKPKER